MSILLRKFAFYVSVCALTFGLAITVKADAPADPEVDLCQVDLEHLLEIKVTSPSKKVEKLSNVASAIYVPTEQDIRRSGATSLAELFRLVPGVYAARLDNNQSQIGSRGFNSVFSDKLLVLLDGRSIFSPLLSGAFWNEEDVLLEDIERIEVIRGPGATIWGADAAHGVINVITKNAAKTHGGLVTTAAGNELRFFQGLRYGGKVADTDYRFYSKYINQDPNDLVNGGGAHDSREGVKSGFRTDTAISEQSTFTVQGDIDYSEAGWNSIVPGEGEEGPEFLDETRYRHGANLLARWTTRHSKDSETSLRAYVDHTRREYVLFEDSGDVFDIEAQHRLSPLNSHDVVVGAGYRSFEHDIDRMVEGGLFPLNEPANLSTIFLQDDMTIIPERLHFIAGYKVEHSDYDDFEDLPSVRAVFTPNSTHSFWSAISKGSKRQEIMTQAHEENEEHAGEEGGVEEGEAGGSSGETLGGVNDYLSEKVISYEAGYRSRVLEDLSFDVAFFFNDYTHTDSPLFRESGGEEGEGEESHEEEGSQEGEESHEEGEQSKGEAWGGEATVIWRPVHSWKLIASYSYFALELQEEVHDDEAALEARQTPHNQILVRSLFDITPDVEFDMTYRFLDNVPDFSVPSYSELDARLAWKVNDNLVLSLVGQNLLEENHIEYISNPVTAQATQIQRGVFGQLTWRF